VKNGSSLLRWASWSALYAIAAGGHPWRFPADGRYWREAAFSVARDRFVVYPKRVRMSRSKMRKAGQHSVGFDLRKQGVGFDSDFFL
jgi:hypothetical protein